MIKVEYLLVVEKADAFCDTAEALNKLLDVDSRLTVKDGKVTCDGGTEYDYTVQAGEVPNKGQRYFQLVFSLDAQSDDENVDAFAQMLSVVRSVLRRLSSNLDILRDDLSTFYSELGYQKVHHIENLMRQLITKFMVVNVGADWVKESTPKPVKDALDASKRKGWSTNVLDEVDFIVLSYYLLQPYCRGPRDRALTELEAVDSIEKLEAFKTRFCLQSNWTRYFSGIVDCDAEFLQKRWETLYELRCKVAHNALVNKQDYEHIQRLVSELEDPLATAIQKIGEVTVPEDEVDQVVQEADATTETSSQVQKLRADGVSPSVLGHLGIPAASAFANLLQNTPSISANSAFANVMPQIPGISANSAFANVMPQIPGVSASSAFANVMPQIPGVSANSAFANVMPQIPGVSANSAFANVMPQIPGVPKASSVPDAVPNLSQLISPHDVEAFPAADNPKISDDVEAPGIDETDEQDKNG